MSSYEEHILKILRKQRIEFVREKTFPDLNNGKYRFDFYLPKNNIIIEINGEQHYRYISRFYKNRQDFLKAKERDRKKISYCLINKIKLYIIPYWEIENIYSFKDITKEKFLAKSKWHNDFKGVDSNGKIR